MINNMIFITVDHIEEFKPFIDFKIGEVLKIGKETDNTFLQPDSASLWNTNVIMVLFI